MFNNLRKEKKEEGFSCRINKIIGRGDLIQSLLRPFFDFINQGCVSINLVNKGRWIDVIGNTICTNQISQCIFKLVSVRLNS